MERDPRSSPSAGDDSLGACLRRVYLLLIGPDGPVRPIPLNSAAWPRTAKVVAQALRRIGGPVRFDDPNSTEGTAVVAWFAPRQGPVLLTPWEGAAAKLLRADDFDMDGRPRA